MSRVRGPFSIDRTNTAEELIDDMFSGRRHSRSRCSITVVLPEPGTGESSCSRGVA
jgi:hypothetical protein